MTDPRYPLPTEDEIEDTLQKINDILDRPAIKNPVNTSIRQGYTEAAGILADDRRTYAGIAANVPSTQGRAIAVIAVDYLNGGITAEQLLNVPLKPIPFKDRLKHA